MYLYLLLSPLSDSSNFTFIHSDTLSYKERDIIIIAIIAVILGYIIRISESISLAKLVYYIFIILVLIDMWSFELSTNSYKAMFCFFDIPIKVYIINKADTLANIYQGIKIHYH